MDYKYNVSKCQQNDTRVYEGCIEVISNKPNTCPPLGVEVISEFEEFEEFKE